ncbi:MAG: recombinase RecT [Bacteroidales bacterium]|jgi:recombination protein RecT|nr:recombinase RecT [Bacteroidales bacterium]
MNNDIQNQNDRGQRKPTPMQRFNLYLTNDKTQGYLMQVLGEKKPSFVNNLIALVSNNRQLQECTPESVMYAAIKATALDLPLDANLGFAFVIPYWNSKTGRQEAQFQIGYRGFIQLAMRSGQFRTINVRDVREGEIEDENFVSGELKFKKLADKREEAPIIGYVSYFALINGFEKMSYWTIEKLTNHAKKYSQTFGSEKAYIRKSSRWTTDFEAMAEKTALKLLLSKYAPLSVEMQGAIQADQAVLDDKGAHYIDNEADVAEQNAKAADVLSKALEPEKTKTDDAPDTDIDVDPETGEIMQDDESGQPQAKEKFTPDRTLL